MTKKTSKKPESDSLKKDEKKTAKDLPEEVQEKEVSVAKEPEEVSEEEELEEKEKSSEEIIQELQDKYIRLSADFDNYRKRNLKEKMDLIKLAGEDILLKLLPVLDDFDRALQTMNEATDCEAMKEGVDLIHNKFKEFLSSNGIKEISAMNEEFNTDLHEAVTKVPAPSKKMKGKIVDVIEKGYFLHDKVIRYSKVVIGE